MTMPGRTLSLSVGDKHRFGFQGQETDQEFMGGAVSYKYRIHDARIGRFLSVDPLTPEYPFYSPYAFSGNRVIDMVELEGLEPAKPGTNVGDYSTAADMQNGGSYGWTWTGEDWKRGLEEVLITDLEAKYYNELSASYHNYLQTNLDNYIADSYPLQFTTRNDVRMGVYPTSLENDARQKAIRDFAQQTITYAGGGSNYHDARNRYKFLLGTTEGFEALPEQGLDYIDPINFIGIGQGLVGLSSKALGAVGIATRGSSFLKGGKTFSQYKAANGGGGLVGEISLNTPHRFYGTKFPVRVEYSHRWITQAAQRKYNLPNWMVNNKLNVIKTNTLRHAGHDPFRYRFLPREIKLRLGPGGDLNYYMFGK